MAAPRRLAWVGAGLLLLALLAAALFLFYTPPPGAGPPRGAGVSAPPEPETSMLLVPYALPLDALEASIEERLPPLLADETGREISEGWRMDLRAERTGPVVLHGREGALVTTVPLTVAVKAYAAKKAERREARGDPPPSGVRVDADVVLTLTTRLALSDDWHLRSTSTLSHEWLGKPTLSLGILHFPIERLADRTLEKAYPDVEAQMDAAMAEQDTTRDAMERTWTALATPSRVSEAPPTWWVGRPEHLYASVPVVEDDALSVVLGTSGRFAIVLGDPAPATVPPLPPREDPPDDAGFHLAVPMILEWTAISEAAEAALVGWTTTLPVAGAEIGSLTITGVELYPSGDAIVVALAYSAAHPGWTTDGTVYLAGRPELDTARHVLRIEDFDYVIDTWDRSITGVNALVRSGLRERLAETLEFPYAEQLETARERIREGLDHEGEGGATVLGRIDTLEILGVRLTDAAIVIDALATGTMAIVQTRLDGRRREERP